MNLEKNVMKRLKNFPNNQIINYLYFIFLYYQVIFNYLIYFSRIIFHLNIYNGDWAKFQHAYKLKINYN